MILLAGSLKAFPDFSGTIVTSFGAGEFGVFEMEFKGTNEGPLGPMKATHESLDAHELQVNQYANGKLSRSWSWSDGLETITELGLAPPSVPSTK